MLEDEGPEEEEGPLKQPAGKTFRRLLPHLRPHWRTLVAALFTVTVINACWLAGPWVLGQVVDTILSDGAVETLVLLTAAFLVTVAIAAGVGFVQQLMLTRMGLRIITALKERVFSHLLSLSVKFHGQNPVGKLIARTENDAETVKELFSRVAVQIFQSVTLFAATLTTMLVMDFQVTFVLVILVPVMALGTIWFFRAIRRIYREVRRRYADLAGMVTEYVQGVPVVQQFNQQDRALALMDEKNLAKFKVEMKGWYLDYSFWGIFLFGETIAACAILWFGSGRIASGAMSVGLLVTFLEYTRRIFEPILHLGEQLTQVQRALASADRVFDLLDTPAEVADAPDAEDGLEFREAVEFENVSYSYDGEKNVLDDISFRVAKGERVALVGPSGGGKSTLVGLLCRFLDPTAGCVRVDGRDLRECTQRAWRDRIGLVLQEIYLFPGSVLDNLRVLDESIPDEAVHRAARAVTADSFIEPLPDGYEADLAERGANLSLGERQILSFARALTSDPDLLVLDEATSSVDPHTESQIQESLEKLLAGRTAVIVAHRLSTIRSADRILVVVDGRIVEEGRHEELYDAGGLYREMFDLQTRGNGNGRRP